MKYSLSCKLSKFKTVGISIPVFVFFWFDKSVKFWYCSYSASSRDFFAVLNDCGPCVLVKIGLKMRYGGRR